MIISRYDREISNMHQHTLTDTQTFGDDHYDYIYLKMNTRRQRDMIIEMTLWR